VREAYQEGYFRTSIVNDPFTRINTQDNTPAVIHTRLVPGDQIKLTVMPKGGGAENMSALRMLTPADGWEGVSRFIIDTVSKAGANPCPPVIVGIGIGGTFEKAALIAKRSLLRPIGQRNPDPVYAGREIQLLEAINHLGIGPQGCGGSCTALDVFIETHPCHIASLPVAVNLQCHSARHREIIL
jgi:fumarate hydratase subunit alpha